jgi:hypothetical protein
VAITFVAATRSSISSGSSQTPTLPAGAAVDDILLINAACWDSTLTASMVGNQAAAEAGTGWHELVDQVNSAGSGQGIGHKVYWCRYNGSMPSATITWSGSGDGKLAGMSAWRGVKTTGLPITVGSVGGGSDSSAEHSTVTTPAANCMLVMLGGVDFADAVVMHSGFASAYEDAAAGTDNTYRGSALSIWCHYLIQAAAGASGTKTVTGVTTSGGGWGSVLLALEPATGAIFNQTVTVTATTSVALGKAVGKLLAVSVADTVVVARAVAKTIAVAATATVTRTKAVTKTLAVTATSSVVLVASRLFNVVVTVTATTSTTVRKAVGKISAVTATSSVAMQKAVGKVIAVTATGAVVVRKAVGKLVAAVATTTTSVRKAVGKVLAAIATSTVVVNAILVAAPVVYNVTVTVTATTSVAVSKAVGKTLAVAAASSVVMRKAVGKVLAAAAASSVTLQKAVGKLVAVSSTASVVVRKAVAKTLAVSATGLVVVRKSIAKTLAVTATTAVSVATLFQIYVQQSLVYASLGFRPIIRVMSIALENLLGGEVDTRPVPKTDASIEPLTDAKHRTQPSVRGKPDVVEEP